MALRALTGTGRMVAVDGVGLESWGKVQTQEELSMWFSKRPES